MLVIKGLLQGHRILALSAESESTGWSIERQKGQKAEKWTRFGIIDGQLISQKLECDGPGGCSS